MARNVWKSYVKVYLAVETLKSIHSRGLKIPKELIEAYKQKTRNSGRRARSRNSLKDYRKSRQS